MSAKHALYRRYYPWLRYAAEQWKTNWFTYCLLAIVLIAIYKKHHDRVQLLMPNHAPPSEITEQNLLALRSGAKNSPVYDPKAIEAFLLRFRATAMQEEQKFGIPADVILAIALVQSSGGTNLLATQKQNYFGLRTGASDTYAIYRTPWESFRAFSTQVRRAAGNKKQRRGTENWVQLVEESGICITQQDFKVQVMEVLTTKGTKGH
jgi:Mannosyl-glycoprotein endo-beta-N-acetylglucosaminidase